jgi:hypothetical protein
MARNPANLQPAPISTALLGLVLFMACASPADFEEGPSFNKKGSKAVLGGSLVAGTVDLASGDPPWLTSTCPGETSTEFVVLFKQSGCLVVDISQQFWTGSMAPYTLSDDLLLNVQRESKHGRITHVRLAGQDVEGPDGIWHNMDWLQLAEPVQPSTDGFTLRVHATNVAVWRTDSHQARGAKRVEIIGTISIGEIVYQPR